MQVVTSRSWPTLVSSHGWARAGDISCVNKLGDITELTGGGEARKEARDYSLL